MKVQAIKSFVEVGPGDRKYRIEQDQVLELPDGCEHWLAVGFVIPVRVQEVETMTRAAPEKAVTRKPKETKAVDKVMKTRGK